MTRILLAAACALAAVAPLAAPLAAQSGDGFSFGRPHANISIRGGLAQPSASSDAFRETRRELTVGRNAFTSAAVQADLGIRLTNRFDVQIGAGSSARSVPSEFRNWVDNNDQPIEQTTAFHRFPFSLGLKYHLTSPGRALSRLVYIPSRVTPYIGAGGGMMRYSFTQDGDFFDYNSLDVFRDKLQASGWAPMAYANVGVDVTVLPNVGLVSELRYDHARGAMSRDFDGYNRIDLSGVALTAGVTLRF